MLYGGMSFAKLKRQDKMSAVKSEGGVAFCDRQILKSVIAAAGKVAPFCQTSDCQFHWSTKIVSDANSLNNSRLFNKPVLATFTSLEIAPYSSVMMYLLTTHW